jgi:hypothetical protein
LLFISDDPLHVVIRSAIKPLFDTKGNQIQPPQRRLFAKFQRGSAPSWAVAIGEETFAMANRPAEVPVSAWLSAYDTEADSQWNDEERAVIEAELLTRDGVVLVEKARLAPPYPMYDKHRKTVGKRTVEHAIADIVAAYESAGFDVEHAVAYERENGNSAEVIAALNALIETPETVDKETVIAA